MKPTRWTFARTSTSLTPMIATIRRGVQTIPSETRKVFLALLALDAILIMIHSLHVRYDVPGSGLWLISRDRGIPEIFQYGKEAAIIVLLVACYRHRRSLIYLAWAVTFCYFLADDAFEVHETAGGRLAEGLGLGQPFGIEGRDAGQILVSASAGLLLVGAIALATNNDHSPARFLTWRLIPVLVALGFFGVVADAIDAIDILGLVEDGGEMVTMTVAVAIVVEHWRRTISEPAPMPARPVPSAVTGDTT